MLKLLLDLIIPPTCHVCHSRLRSGHEFLCEACLSQLPETGYDDWENNPMAARFAGIIPFEKATACYFYSRDSQLAQLIQDFKYRQMPSLAQILAADAATRFQPSGFFDDIDAVMSIPMHFYKQAKRGYNQADYIARGISEVTRIPIIRCLKAVKSHKTQTHLTAIRRQDNLKNTFKVIAPERLYGKHILLADDVCTTGATLIAASEALLAAQPTVRISFFTLATTP